MSDNIATFNGDNPCADSAQKCAEALREAELKLQ